MQKIVKRLPLIALAALPLTLGTVMAQGGSQPTPPQPMTQPTTQPLPTSTTPPVPGPQGAPHRPGGEQGKPNSQARAAFVQKLAAQLGVSPERLRAAAVAAARATLDQQVKAGKLPAERAAKLKTELQQDPFMPLGGEPLPGRAGGPGHHHGPAERGGPEGFGPIGGQQAGPRGPITQPGSRPDNRNQGPVGGPLGQNQNNQIQPNQNQPGQPQPGAPERGPAGAPPAHLNAPLDAAIARALGLSESQLREQLRSGQSVSQLAQAKGISTTQIHAAAVAALNTALQAEVTAGRLSQAQAAQMLQQAQADARFGLLEHRQK